MLRDQFGLLLLLYPCCLLAPRRTFSVLNPQSSHQVLLPERKLPIIKHHKMQDVRQVSDLLVEKWCTKNTLHTGLSLAETDTVQY